MEKNGEREENSKIDVKERSCVCVREREELSKILLNKEKTIQKAIYIYLYIYIYIYIAFCIYIYIYIYIYITTSCDIEESVGQKY